MEHGGYVVSDYLKNEGDTTPEEPSTEPEPNVNLNNCKIDGNNLIISPGTTIDQIESAVLEGSVLGTGAKITVNGVTYTLVVLGDVSGDGEIKAKDYMMIKNYIMGTLNLNEAEKKAADVSKDNAIKAKDYMMIKNHIMGTSSITL